MMKERDPLVSFLTIYFLLILTGYLITFIPVALGEQAFVATTRLLFAIGQASLTEVGATPAAASNSTIFILLSLLITQLSGIVFLSFGLWFYWRLFSIRQQSGQLTEALKFTIKVSLLTESVLFLFFLYAQPPTLDHIAFSTKALAALSLAVGSFNNAGFPFFEATQFRAALVGDSIIQLGIIAGTAIGNLGIYVIDELLNPKNLRKRLENPETDWSFMTKLIVFGSCMSLGVLSAAYWWIESGNSLSHLNTMEALIASLHDISVTRGFGFAMENGSNASSIVQFAGSAFTAAPFATGGGFTLLFLAYIIRNLRPKYVPSNDTQLAAMIASRLALYTFASLLLLAVVSFLIVQEQRLVDVFIDLWSAFTTNKLAVNDATSWPAAIVVGSSAIVGRIGFIVVCYLTLIRNST